MKPNISNSMADDFTPPDSPLADNSQYTPLPLPFFTCAKGSYNVWWKGYANCDTLKRLELRTDPAPNHYNTDTVDIFGFPWVTETSLVESTKLLFGLFKQTIHKLEALEKGPYEFGQQKAHELREQCGYFLHYVNVFLFRFFAPSRTTDSGRTHPFEELEALFPSVLVEELHGITLLIGRLKDQSTELERATTIPFEAQILPPPWYLLHLHLDIHWAVLDILNMLAFKMEGQVVYAHQFANLTGENLTDSSLFDKHLCSLLRDLVGLAIGKYSKVRHPEALSSHHYFCTCTRELWTLLICLLDYRHRTLRTQPFWDYVNALLRPLLKEETAAEQFAGFPISCIEPLGFNWWLVTHIAILSPGGKEGHAGENWTYVEELLKLTCKPKGGLSEEYIRMHVHCALTLCLVWEPSTTAVSILWDYYSKNLSLSFTVPWLGISDFETLHKTPLALLEQARSCCSNFHPRSQEHTQLFLSSSSFHIFLRVLAVCLSQDKSGRVAQRQIKGRIYSKFSPKKMKELSETGLTHFLLLFLVMARQADLEDVASRACELLGHLPSNCPPATRTLVWRGQLALLLLFQERGLDVGAQASWLASSFNETAKEFYDKTTEASRKIALWGPLGSYLDGVAEVFETSATLGLSEEKLLNEGFGWLLPACRQSELNSALGFLQNILAQLRRVHQRSVQSAPAPAWPPPPPAAGSAAKERHLAVAAALWAHFFPFLRGLRLSQTPPPQLADAAAGFTLLAFDLPSSAPQDLQPNPVQSILQCFGFDDMVHPRLVTRYLPHVLQNSELVSSLSGDSSVDVTGSAQSLSVRAWFRCVLQQHLHKNPDGTESRTDRAAEEQLSELTRLVLRLPEVDGLLQRAGVQPPSSKPEPASALEMFVKAVGNIYSGLQLLPERSSMVTKALDYIGDVLKHIKPSLISKNQEGIRLAYWAVGCLVKHWSPLLATSKGQQLLFRIVDGLLLTRNLPQQDKALRDSLPLFLQGLSVASSVSQSQGVYIKQQLRSVTRRYLDHFLPASPSVGAVANHPVLLGACEAGATVRGAALRRTVLEVLCENFLQFKGHAPPPRLASVLMFLLELLRRNSDSDPALLTLPFPSLLRCLMLVNEPQVRKTSTDAIQLVVERCAAASAQGPCEQMIAVLRSFVGENEGVYDRQVYGALETLAVLDPPVVRALIPDLSLSLRNTEYKRGLGKNIALRGAYTKLLQLLGESGQAEITSLEGD